jgi:hypothetical protein
VPGASGVAQTSAAARSDATGIVTKQAWLVESVVTKPPTSGPTMTATETAVPHRLFMRLSSRGLLVRKRG